MLNKPMRSILLKALGLVFCIAPVTACVLTYFPIWREAGKAEMLSGITVLLLAMALVPLFNAVKKILHSPSAYMLWLFSFLLFFMLSKIADEMTVISFVGFVGNLIGAILMKLGRKFENEG